MSLLPVVPTNSSEVPATSKRKMLQTSVPVMLRSWLNPRKSVVHGSCGSLCAISGWACPPANKWPPSPQGADSRGTVWRLLCPQHSSHWYVTQGFSCLLVLVVFFFTPDCPQLHSIVGPRSMLKSLDIVCSARSHYFPFFKQCNKLLWQLFLQPHHTLNPCRALWSTKLIIFPLNSLRAWDL